MLPWEIFTLCMCLLNGENYFAVHIYILSLLISFTQMFVCHNCYCLITNCIIMEASQTLHQD
jgi:hypothetical protein